jgi:uncharacterized protein
MPVQKLLEHAAHYLPVQGPIGVFVHHNTLHAFQHLPFEEAVVEASRLFGTEPWLTEERYRSELAQGRILLEDLKAVLAAEPNASITGNVDRQLLRRLMLFPGIRPLNPSTVRWELEDGGLLVTPEDQDLYEACLEVCSQFTPPAPGHRPRRLRNALLSVSGDDLDGLIHPLLIRLCSAFLDQGLSYWPMPDRERGFYAAVCQLWRKPGALMPNHLSGLPAEFRWQSAAGMTAEDTVRNTLQRLQVPADCWDDVITSELLALPGWAGLMRRLEQEPSLAPRENLPCSLMDFLAVRMTLNLVAATSIAGGADWLRSLWEERPAESQDAGMLQVHAGELFQVACLLRRTGDHLRERKAMARRLYEEVQLFDELERRRIWHLAYERRHERLILGPLGKHRQRVLHVGRPDRPESQVFFCIDEREESIRRHLEEVAPSCETFGAAGFFGVAVDYKGIDDADPVSLCPVVVQPQHAIRELPTDEHKDAHKRRRALRALWARITRNVSLSTRSLVRGSLSTVVLGGLSVFPLAAHILSPGRYRRLLRAMNQWILPEPKTELTLMRADAHAHEVAEHLMLGFTIDEKADRVASVLKPAGLLSNFAPIVLILGHGSTSLNNPLRSAYDCGACGGRRGGPNARLFAAMANHAEVRERLRARGIDLPADTWFVGGCHDTCSDDIEYYESEAIPESLRNQFDRLRVALDEARARNAHERSRRFEAASGEESPLSALRHVQERAEHLAEPRPEYGHCTNAVCLVGRRELTRGLFLDRRAFLVSYDPTVDPEGENLGRLLNAVIPVCGGISLEYFFSSVDNEGYGCGTKLPHNIAGLIGVMNGAASDLRTGLAQQMVEIHEPVRILFNVEARTDVLLNVIRSNPMLTEFVENRWIRLSAMDPDTGEVSVYRADGFEPSEPWTSELPKVPRSADWYEGRTGHLPVAQIASALPA